MAGLFTTSNTPWWACQMFFFISETDFCNVRLVWAADCMWEHAVLMWMKSAYIHCQMCPIGGSNALFCRRCPFLYRQVGIWSINSHSVSFKGWYSIFETWSRDLKRQHLEKAFVIEALPTDLQHTFDKWNIKYVVWQTAACSSHWRRVTLVIKLKANIWFVVVKPVYCLSV